MVQQAGFSLQNRNPDVLTSIANLSNDEVFTPPSFANRMLDTVEEAWAKNSGGANIWEDKTVTFLDPFTKSGVFLREITRRLSKGLEKEIPDTQERVNHILTRQVFGVAITQLTALLARRSVYCSKYANGEHSICTEFDTPEGNIWFERTEHTWVGGKEKVITAGNDGKEVEVTLDGACKFCGARRKEYERGLESESHAYSLIHTGDPNSWVKSTFGEGMQFDVIVGNPPYQLSVGNTEGNSSKAKSIYHLFVTQAMALEPRYLSMVVPSRWMTRSADGIPDKWIDDFIADHRIRRMNDFLDSKSCFPGVAIEGGVCTFLWDRDNAGECAYVMQEANGAEPIQHVGFLDSIGAGIVVRDARALSIIQKILDVEGGEYISSGNNFSSLVSPKDFFTNKQKLTSSWSGFSAKKEGPNSIKCYVNRSIHGRSYGYVAIDDVPKNRESIGIPKVYIPAARGSSAHESKDQVLGRPFVGEPGSVCTQTYLVIGFNPIEHSFTLEECQQIASYISTKFFRFLVSLKKRTQNGPRGVYQFVPLQDFSQIWTDKKLYEKYNLDSGEISLIESKIREMDLADA